jgi:uncharacterized protein
MTTESSQTDPLKGVNTYPEIPALDLSEYPAGQVTNFFLNLYEDALGVPVKVPFIVAKGKRPGPVIGITAAVHGNELNGIRIIHALLKTVDVSTLKGTLLCVPVVNVPAYNLGQRSFIDGVDLNSAFPGKAQGTPSSQYARAFSKTFLSVCDYLIDLHTASEGRVNSLYVRVDLSYAEAYRLATLFNPEIILHNPGGDGTLRSAARRAEIPAITIEAGNPSVIQHRMVHDGVRGICNILSGLRLLKREVDTCHDTVVCTSSKWLRTTGGGILNLHVKLRQHVEKRQLVAEKMDCFGNALEGYTAPYDGIVIGMASDPTSVPGTRFCHLGHIGSKSEIRALAKGSALVG